MKSAALPLFALLFASSALAAQTGGWGQSSYGVARMESQDTANTISAFGMPVHAGCPVSLRAQHGVTAGMLQADRSRPQGIAQLLHLSMLDIDVDAKRIVSARVRVHGLSGKSRVTQTLSAESGFSKDDGDFVRSMDVQLPYRTGRTVSGDLWVPGMTAVLSVVVNSVTYDDGSSRSFSAQDNCRVTPDPLMLVSGR